VPTTFRDICWRVAQKIALPEFLQRGEKHGSQVARRFDLEQPAAGRARQLAKKRSISRACRDAVDNDF
jgi:hypothetical protein